MHTIKTNNYIISFDEVYGRVAPEGDWMAFEAGLGKIYALDFTLSSEAGVQILRFAPNEKQTAFTRPNRIVDLNFSNETPIFENDAILNKEDAVSHALLYKSNTDSDYIGSDFYSLEKYSWGYKYSLYNWILGVYPGSICSWLVTEVGPAINIGGLEFNFNRLRIEKIRS